MEHHWERKWQNKDCEILFSCLAEEMMKRRQELDIDASEAMRVLVALMRQLDDELELFKDVEH